MNTPWYATREDIMRSLDVQQSARNRRQIDDALEAATGSVDALCHRRFYPETTTRRFDWPSRSGSTPWIVRLNDNEAITVSALSTGTVIIDPANYFLRRADDRDEPPYTRIELSLNSQASFGLGPTYQRDITVTGLFGYRNDETTLGSTTASVASTTATTIAVDAATSAVAGVGSLLRLDSEHLIVTERTQASTGQTGTLTSAKNDVTLTVTNGAAYAVDEVLTLDAERVRVDDITGNTLTVERAYDGTVLAAHTTATIYAPRTLTVTRGVLGTTAATHSNTATVYLFRPPSLVHQLTKAEAITQLTQERAGWFMKASTSGNSAGKVSADALQTLRDQTYTAHGRKARHRAV